MNLWTISKMWNSLLSVLTVGVSLCLPFSCCCGLFSRNRIFDFLEYVQFVLIRIYKSQDRLARGGHESVENWTTGSGHIVTYCVLLSRCLPCSDPSFLGCDLIVAL